MLNISLGASQPFGIPQLRILCLALYPITHVDAHSHPLDEVQTQGGFVL